MRAVLPDAPLVASATGEGVVVTGVLTARADAGGGLAYEGFSTRICLRYRVAAVSGETAVDDAPCPAPGPGDASVDETVSLAG